MSAGVFLILTTLDDDDDDLPEEKSAESWSGIQLEEEKQKEEARRQKKARPLFNFSLPFFKKKKKPEIVPPPVRYENALPPIYMKLQSGAEAPTLGFLNKDIYFFHEGIAGKIYPAVKYDWNDLFGITHEAGEKARQVVKISENADMVQFFSNEVRALVKKAKEMPAEAFDAKVEDMLKQDPTLFKHEAKIGIEQGEEKRTLVNNIIWYHSGPLGLKNCDDVFELCAYMTANRDQMSARYFSGDRPDHDVFNQTVTEFRDYKRREILTKSVKKPQP